MKVVINKCYGGFGVSTKATLLMRARGNAMAIFTMLSDGRNAWLRGIDRSDPQLVAVVEELGVEANGDCAELRVVEIPDGVEWEISACDGMEIVRGVSPVWG